MPSAKHSQRAGLNAAAALLFLFSLCGCHIFWAAGYTNITDDGGSSDIGAYGLVTRARYAQRLEEAGHHDEAIAQYRKHIEERLADPRRPADENPYFYEILIGDIYLHLDKAEDAEASYRTAYEKDVARPFIIDRMRQLGAWYEQHGRLEAARDLLKQYRQLDTLLFDFDLDRIGKKIVSRDEQERIQ